MSRRRKHYECPHCTAVDSLLISDWSINLGTGQTDCRNGYICGKCLGRVEAVRTGRKHLRIEPKARKVMVQD